MSFAALTIDLDLRYEHPLVIDWSVIKYYNTVMSTLAGAGLALIGSVMKDLIRGTDLRPKGWAAGFLIVGLPMLATGLHMTLTWPMAPRFAPDNIIFGEPSLLLGGILVGLAWYFSARSDAILAAEHPTSFIAKDLLGMRFLLLGAGMNLIAIAIAAVWWQFFIAPIEEPIAGLTEKYNVPWLTNLPVAALFAGIGLIAILVPPVMVRQSMPGDELSGLELYVPDILKYLGLALIALGAFVTLTHIGMVYNTSDVIPH